MNTNQNWQAIKDYLSSFAEPLQAFREALTPLFTAMADQKLPASRQFVRRPQISLRLIANGEPLGKLIALPCSRNVYGTKYLACDCVHCELMIERQVTTASDKVGKNLQRWLAITIRPDSVHLSRASRSVAVAFGHVDRVVATMTDFVQDHCAVLARCRDECCICGRRLTDELSRARGIGPECLKIAKYLAVVSDRNLIEAEGIFAGGVA